MIVVSDMIVPATPGANPRIRTRTVAVSKRFAKSAVFSWSSKPFSLCTRSGANRSLVMKPIHHQGISTCRKILSKISKRSGP